MANDVNNSTNSNPATTTDNVENQNPSAEQRDENTMIPRSRLNEEVAKRREMESKLKQYEDSERKRKEADMAATELLKQREVELTTLKQEYAHEKVMNKAVLDLKEAGFDEKIIRLGLNDLTDDNYKDRIKTFVKEFADYAKKPTTEPQKPNPLASMQQQPTIPDTKEDPLRAATKAIFSK